MNKYSIITITVLFALLGCRESEDTQAKVDELIIYSGRSQNLVEPLIEQFSELTEIPVSVKYGKTGAIAGIIIEEGSKSPADIFFAQDPGGLGSVYEQLTVLPESINNQVPEWARDKNGKWVGISGRARVVVYNTDSLTEEDLPDSIEDFTDPAWKGRIGWAPGNSSFQSMLSAMRLIWGEDRTKRWLEGIVRNEPNIYPKNTPIVDAAGKGEIDVGFVNHYYLHRFLTEKGEGFKARNYYTRSADPGSLILAAAAGILDTSKNKESAERFLNFMLSSTGQQYFAGQTFEFPINDKAKPSLLLPKLDELTRPEINLSDLSDVKGTQLLLLETKALTGGN
ncbi:iron ABC transporter substrate-binding protein [Dehalococcoidia bacterium]|nr:iron ABC transporter substrate-binding protein [Dehalococcoidia bacterium]